MTDFDEFVEKKRLKLPNRRYEYKYPKNVDLIKKIIARVLRKTYKHNVVAIFL